MRLPGHAVHRARRHGGAHQPQDRPAHVTCSVVLINSERHVPHIMHKVSRKLLVPGGQNEPAHHHVDFRWVFHLGAEHAVALQEEEVTGYQSRPFASAA